MNKEKDFFKTCFDTVAGLEVKNKSQAIAKEVVLSEIENLQQENKQLQNNWNELKKWLEEQEQKAWDEVSSTFGYVLNKMQELEGSDSNE